MKKISIVGICLVLFSCISTYLLALLGVMIPDIISTIGIAGVILAIWIPLFIGRKKPYIVNRKTKITIVVALCILAFVTVITTISTHF